MKKVKPNYYKDIIKELQSLKQKHPSYSMGRHISTIIEEYSDVWGMTDKEFLFALTKYKATLEMDVPHDENTEDIIKEGLNLSISSILDDENYEGQEY